MVSYHSLKGLQIFWARTSKKYVYVVVIANHSKTRVEIGSDCFLGKVSKDYLSNGFLKSL